MSYGSFFGIAAGILAMAAYVPYIYSVLKGRTRPNRASWFIWSVLGIIIFASYWSIGARDTIWFVMPFGMIITALLSVKYGVGGWTPFDRLCLIGAGAGLLLWWISGIALTALIISIMIDMVGYLPTIRKLWHDQKSEDALAWMMFVAGAALNIFALESWAFELAVVPIYLLVFNSTVLALILIPRQGRQREISQNFVRYGKSDLPFKRKDK